MKKIKSFFREIAILCNILDYDAQLEELKKDPPELRCNALMKYAEKIKIPTDEIRYGNKDEYECEKIEAIIKKYCYVRLGHLFGMFSLLIAVLSFIISFFSFLIIVF